MIVRKLALCLVFSPSKFIILASYYLDYFLFDHKLTVCLVVLHTICMFNLYIPPLRLCRERAHVWNKRKDIGDVVSQGRFPSKFSCLHNNLILIVLQQEPPFKNVYDYQSHVLRKSPKHPQKISDGAKGCPQSAVKE